MSYSTDPTTANCYDGTTCLINKFGIKDDNAQTNILYRFFKSH